MGHFAIKDWTIPTVCDTFVSERARWGKSFMFFLTTNQCYSAKAYLEARGIYDVEVVTGNTDRESQLSDFRAGKTNLLIGMKVISEGIDVPDLRSVFVRDSQKGPTIQMAGRVFRNHPDIEFKQIIQSDKTKWPMARTAFPVEQWLRQDESWRSVRVNPHINKIVSKTMTMMARTKVDMPSYLELRKKKQSWTGT